MEIPTLLARPLELESVIDSDVVAIGFTRSESGEFAFPSSSEMVGRVESKFELNLTDELTFFSATGKAGEVFEIPLSTSDAKIERLIFVGLGKQSVTDFRNAGAALGRKMRGTSKSLYSLAASSRTDIRAHAIALVLGAYLWNQKTGTKKSEVPKFLVADTHSPEVQRAAIMAKHVWLTRDLIHTPSNIKNPAWIAEQAKSMAKKSDLAIKVLAGKELDGFGGLIAVGNSSPNPGPRFIEVTYAPKGSKTWPHVVLVGKGITFDTGGVSLKRPYENMIGMKSDMAGAAAVLSVISAMPDIKPRVRVTALLMCAENALSSTAQRPSDVITHYGGTTVEVINTDAEGRLVLADGLAYADRKLNPDYLVDVATLTGAATVGLSRNYAAMYTRDVALAKTLSSLGEKSGDRVWHMPLLDDYKGALTSEIADFNHTANGAQFSAGSVTAALFLEHFVGKRNWVHLDIAGPARSESDAGENPKGGTGFGVRLLMDWIAGL
ncbi:MAG: leucyl aminopeptidase family protein [Candidatus Nanopelagicaceae bacterium]|nr:leucyl aminopeptidase family protein [Candidatus Nanopelagicaceae bacterium]